MKEVSNLNEWLFSDEADISLIIDSALMQGDPFLVINPYGYLGMLSHAKDFANSIGEIWR